MLRKTLAGGLVLLLTIAFAGMALASAADEQPGTEEQERGRPEWSAGASEILPGPQPGGNDGTMGLNTALERLRAEGSRAAGIIEALIDADGDVAAVARTLGEIDKETGEELDGETEELLTQTAAQLRERVRVENLGEEAKKQTLSRVANFYRNIGSDGEAIETLEEVVEQVPGDIESYQQLGQLYREQGFSGIPTFVNGRKPEFDVEPRVENGRALVPFKALGEALGATVSWNPDSQTVTFEKGDNVVELTIGSLTATVNGEEVTLDVPAFIENGRTVVPLRFISEAMKAYVLYLADTGVIVVNQ